MPDLIAENLNLDAEPMIEQMVQVESSESIIRRTVDIESIEIKAS